MDQSYILKLIVETSGVIVASVGVGTAVALRVLDNKTQEVKQHRIEEEEKRKDVCFIQPSS